MNETITNEVELIFGYADGTNESYTFGPYDSESPVLAGLKTNVAAWNSSAESKSVIVNDSGSSCNGIVGASVITTITTRIL